MRSTAFSGVFSRKPWTETDMRVHKLRGFVICADLIGSNINNNGISAQIRQTGLCQYTGGDGIKNIRKPSNTFHKA